MGMKNRTVPYGYCYENGVVVIQPQESKVLKRIFADYLGGSSLLTIAEALNDDGIEYADGITGWNKGRLKRLTEDERYLGTAIYPQLIREEAYAEVQKLKNRRNTQKGTDRTQDIFRLAVPVRCPSCGSRMSRRHDSRCKCPERWTCENRDCRLLIEFADTDLLQALSDLLKTADADSISIRAVAYEPSAEVIWLTNEINRMLDAPEIDKPALRNRMTECLARKYKELGNECCTAIRLQAGLNSTADISERLNRTVKEIRLSPDKTVSLVLLNGQIIEKESDNGTDCCIPAESGAGH